MELEPTGKVFPLHPASIPCGALVVPCQITPVSLEDGLSLNSFTFLKEHPPSQFFFFLPVLVLNIQIIVDLGEGGEVGELILLVLTQELTVVNRKLTPD